MPPAGVVVSGPAVPGSDWVLTDDALAFVADLERRFGQMRIDLIQRRRERQAELDAGVPLDFLPGTREVREADWTVAPAPADFDDRRVEITGPAEPKMMINALNSGARVFMADLEDALSPTWANLIVGQAALTLVVGATRRKPRSDAWMKASSSWVSSEMWPSFSGCHWTPTHHHSSMS